jgi:hypothetical protein
MSQKKHSARKNLSNKTAPTASPGLDQLREIAKRSRSLRGFLKGAIMLSAKTQCEGGTRIEVNSKGVIVRSLSERDALELFENDWATIVELVDEYPGLAAVFGLIAGALKAK